MAKIKLILLLILLLNTINSFTQTDEVCSFIETYEINDTILSAYLVAFGLNNQTIPVDSAIVFNLINEQIIKEFGYSQPEYISLFEKLIRECQTYAVIYDGYKRAIDKAPKIKPQSEEEYLGWLASDKKSGTLETWTENEMKLVKFECYSELLTTSDNYKELCECVTEAVSKNMNFSKFNSFSEYQKGRAIGTFMRMECVKQE